MSGIWTPPGHQRPAVSAAIAKAAGPKKITTAWVVDGPNGPRLQQSGKSTQLPEDPFGYTQAAGEGGLLRPPYDLDQLAAALEGNSLHSRCAKQKASDVLGRGITLRGKEQKGNAQPAPAEQDRWSQFVEDVEDDDRGDGTFKERLTWAHEDYESIGWSTIEISRGKNGEPDCMWHVPAHTIRAHADGRRFAQRRSGKFVWFKKYGLDGDVDRQRGGWSDTPIADGSIRGNELLVIRNYTPRSDFYGLPDSIPALAAMAGWRAQAQFNVRFFDNHAVPSYAVIIEGADLTPDLEDKIMDHFQKIKGDPARTIVIGVPGVQGDEASAPKIRFERLAVEIKEASFRMYKQDNALEICIAHGMPPYRVGWPIVGGLGGATALEMTKIYNDAIVQPRQETWEQRLNRGLLGKKGLGITQWELKAATLDVRDEMQDLLRSESLYKLGVTTPNDSARFYGFEPRDTKTDPGGDKYIEYPLAPTASRVTVTGAPIGDLAQGSETAAAAAAQQIAKRWMTEVEELSALRKRIGQLFPEAVAA